MKIIQELSDYIDEEIQDAGKYAKRALQYKEDDQTLLNCSTHFPLKKRNT